MNIAMNRSLGLCKDANSNEAQDGDDGDIHHLLNVLWYCYCEDSNVLRLQRLVYDIFHQR